ncbi:UNVERIFIED_CONTAM: hypothetical protein FKN15_075099 [Acipenser sinensis]
MKTTALALFMGALLSLASTQQADPEEPTPAEEEEVEIFTTPATQMAAAASNFGFNLYRQLAYQDPKANMFLSPLSIAGALTQLSLELRLKEDYLNAVEKEYGVRPKALTGSPRADLKEVNDWVRQQTGGKIAHFLSASLPRNMGVLPLSAAPRTEQQLYRVLQYHHLMDPHLHSTLKDLLASVNTPSKGLSMASRVYINRKLRLKEDYLNAVEKEYGVRPKALTGSPRADLKEVNDWVRQQTGGKIAHFLSASLPRNMGVLPLSAAHFRELRLKEDYLNVVEKEYGVRPKALTGSPRADLKEVNDWVRQQTGGKIAHFLSASLPRNMGVLPLSATHFRGLAQLASQPELVKISTLPGKVNTVHHKVSLEVMEEGGQAARSSPSGSGLSLALSFHVNRPFIFLVRDDTSGAILFIGKVMDPRKLKRS